MIELDARAPGWEAGRSPWNVEFHLFCDELSRQIDRFSAQTAGAALTVSAEGWQVTVDATGVPVALSPAAERRTSAYGMVESVGSKVSDQDQWLSTVVCWVVAAALGEMRERKAVAAKGAGGAVPLAEGPVAPQPEGLRGTRINSESRELFEQLCADQARKAELATYLDGGSALVTACYGYAAEQSVKVVVDTGLLVARMTLSGRPEWNPPLSWLMRHGALMMRAWQDEQLATLMADLSRLGEYVPDGREFPDPALASVPDWPFEDVDEQVRREEFLAAATVRFSHAERSIEES